MSPFAPRKQRAYCPLSLRESSVRELNATFAERKATISVDMGSAYGLTSPFLRVAGCVKDAKDLDDIPLKAENDKVRKSPQFGEPVVKPLERSAEEVRLTVNVVEFRIDFRIEVPRPGRLLALRTKGTPAGYRSGRGDGTEGCYWSFPPTCFQSSSRVMPSEGSASSSAARRVASARCQS